MKYLLPYFKKYKLESILAPLFKMLEAMFDLIVPMVVAKIINIGIAGGDRKYIISHFLILIAMAVFGLLCSAVAQFFAAKAAVGTASSLRYRLLGHIQSLGFKELDKTGISTLITRMTADVNQVQNGLNMFLRLFLRSPFIVFGAMIMAFSINFKIALIFAAAIVILFIIVFGIMFITKPMYKSQQAKLDAVTSSTRENLTGVRVIRAFSKEADEYEHFKKINSALEKIQLRVGKISALMNPLTYVVINGGIILILWLGAQSVNSGLLLSGDIIALVNYISQILVELVKLANLIVLLGRAIVSMGRIGQIFDIPPSMSFGSVSEGEATDEIVRFDNVSLKYSEGAENALYNISFTAKKGQTIGIVGSTGSGKTSLVNLISRFYDASDGEIYFMGIPIKKWDKKALRSKIASVMQRVQLFSGTIRSNLQYGKPDATDDEMLEALETAQAADFVKEKDGMLDAIVEQGGRNFSGGQRQRLSIARAVIAKPEILILDDSSSALDYATDAALRRALKKLSDKTTVFIVSQRTSSIAHADKILVLDDGHLVGEGTHGELLKDCAVYREIHESTSKKESE